MTDWKQRADELLAEFRLCCNSRPKANAIDIQILKDSAGAWASHLNYVRAWGNDNEIAEVCLQLEPRLTNLKQQVIIEILTHGTI